MYKLSGAAKAAVRCAFAAAMCLPTAGAHAGSYAVLYAFQGRLDGAQPEGSLVQDSSGNLYSTTYAGGHRKTYKNDSGYGTIFEVSTSGVESILYSFDPRHHGVVAPTAGLIIDASSNFYGTARYGGSTTCQLGCGAAFKFTANGSFQLLYSFLGGADGEYPFAPLMADSSGNLYGTTFQGGGGPCSVYGNAGCGTVFKLAKDGTETVLHAFAGGSDGSYPYAGLIADTAGNLYGTTNGGGSTGCYQNAGCGTVFKVAPDGTEAILYSFAGGSDGAYPYSSLLIDDSGNLYGTTGGGGANGDGTVFELTAGGSEKVLYSFDGGKDGSLPMAGLTADKAGNLFGTTAQGGDPSCFTGDGCGTVFELKTSGGEKILHAFTGGTDGWYPTAGVLAGKSGTLFGTTLNGGGGAACGTQTGCGTVFEIKP